jgi:phosphatidate phosphatase APP1
MKKIHDRLPKRKFICVGDSTQSDPEAYAEMYKKFPDWVVSDLLRSLSKTRAMVTTYAAGRGRLNLEQGVLPAPYP